MIDNSNSNYDSLVRHVLDTSGELPSSEYESMYNTLASEKKPLYLNGDKKQKAMVVQDINEKAQTVKDYKDFRQDLAAAYNTKALMNGWVNSDQGRAVMSLLENKPRLVENTCPDHMNCVDKNQLGVILPNYGEANRAVKTLQDLDEEFSLADENTRDFFSLDYDVERKKLLSTIETDGETWVSIPNLKNSIKLKDKNSKDVLTTMSNNFLSQSTQVNSADNVIFNEPAAKRQIRSNLIDKSNNLESLIRDEMISGRTFYNDFKNKISKHTYADLGINSSPFKKINGKNIITEDESETIVEEMISNPNYKELMKNELTNYFVGHLRNQWKMGELNRPNPAGSKMKKLNIRKYRPGTL